MTLKTLRLSSSGQVVTMHDEGAGAPVVLIHGVGLQSAAWSQQMDALRSTHRVIAVDMPGHGGSAPLAKGSQLPDFVAWFHDFIRTLDIGPVSVVGHSMGALIAGGFAVEHADLTKGVCLMNGVFCRDAAARTAVVGRAKSIKAGVVDRQTPLARWFGSSAKDHAAKIKVAAWLAEVDPKGYATAYAAFADGDETYAGRYRDITCPFLALTGTDDPNSTPAMSRAMVSQSAQGRAVCVDGQRHMVNMTAPDVVNDALRNWLRLAGDKENSNGNT